MLKLELSTRWIIAAIAALIALWALRELWQVFLLVVTAFIFMAALHPYVDWLCRRGMNRAVAVFLMLLLVFAVLGSVVAIVAPAMYDEFQDLHSNLPRYAQDFEDFMSDLGFDTRRWDLPEHAEAIDWNDIISGSQAVDYGQRAALWIFSAFTVAVLTAYLLIDAPRMKRFLYRFVPRGREPDAEHFLAALGRVVGGYVRGQFVTSSIIGVFTTVVLLIVDVPNAVAFGVLAAFADIIPLVGAFIAIVPAVVAAFQESPEQALIVLIALLVYQQFEDRILVPRVYGQTLNLPSLVVFLAAIIGAELMGITGVLLALPAAAAGRVVLDYYLDRREGGTGIPADIPETEVMAPDEPPSPAGGAG